MDSFHIDALILGFIVIGVIGWVLKIVFNIHEYMQSHIEGFNDIQDRIIVGITILVLLFILFDFVRIIYCIGEKLLGYI